MCNKIAKYGGSRCFHQMASFALVMHFVRRCFLLRVMFGGNVLEVKVSCRCCGRRHPAETYDRGNGGVW